LLFAAAAALGSAAGLPAAVASFGAAPRSFGRAAFSSCASKLTTRCAPYALATRASDRSEGR
jgi:hypothetical protein